MHRLTGIDSMQPTVNMCSQDPISTLAARRCIYSPLSQAHNSAGPQLPCLRGVDNTSNRHHSQPLPSVQCLCEAAPQIFFYFYFYFLECQHTFDLTMIVFLTSYFFLLVKEELPDFFKKIIIIKENKTKDIKPNMHVLGVWEEAGVPGK